MTGTTGLRGLFRRLTAPTEDLEAEDLQRHCERSGATPVAGCNRGLPVTVSGRLRSVQYCPRSNLPTLEAELFDGSGSVLLVWIGRRSIVGIEPGRSLTATGRLAHRDEKKVIYNPAYELEPATS